MYAKGTLPQICGGHRIHSGGLPQQQVVGWRLSREHRTTIVRSDDGSYLNLHLVQVETTPAPKSTHSIYKGRILRAVWCAAPTNHVSHPPNARFEVATDKSYQRSSSPS